jgi:predicted RNA binding protein with dsRBD fold (UPF0201 family)
MKTFDQLLEGFKDLTPDKEERVNVYLRRNVNRAKELAGKHKELSKKPLSKFRPGVKKQKSEITQQARKLKGLTSNAVDALTRTSVNRQAALAHKINTIKNQLGDLEGRNNVRNFQRDDAEYVLDYLIDEGFTDSYDSALVILETMSEEWLVDLIESAKEQSDKQIDKGVKTTYKAQNVLDNLHQGRSRGLERIDRRERDAKVERMRGRLKTRRDDLFAERGRREDEKMAKLKKLLGM